MAKIGVEYCQMTVRDTGGLEGDCCSEEAESDGGDGDGGGDGARVLEEGDKDSTEEADEGESDGEDRGNRVLEGD